MSSNFPRRLRGRKTASNVPQGDTSIKSNLLNEPQDTENESESEESEESEDALINDKDIEESLNKIHRQIISLTSSMSKTVVLDQFSWPQLADMHIWYSDCYRLFRSSLCLSDENLDGAFRRLGVDLGDISIYIRMLIASDVYGKVLDAEFPDLPFFSRQWIDSAFDPVIKKLHPQSRADVKHFAAKALARQKNINTKLSELPEDLSRDLFEALNPLLLCHKSPAVDREASKARREKLEEQHGKRLIEIFDDAILLRKAMCRKPFIYSFFWIGAGQEFDNRTMDAEIDLRRADCYESATDHQPRVIATLLPGLRRNKGQSVLQSVSLNHSEEEVVILRALVYLKGTRRS